jgi:hypothetical protein
MAVTLTFGQEVPEDQTEAARIAGPHDVLTFVGLVVEATTAETRRGLRGWIASSTWSPTRFATNHCKDARRDIDAIARATRRFTDDSRAFEVAKPRRRSGVGDAEQIANHGHRERWLLEEMIDKLEQEPRCPGGQEHGPPFLAERGKPLHLSESQFGGLDGALEEEVEPSVPCGVHADGQERVHILGATAFNCHGDGQQWARQHAIAHEEQRDE